MFRLEFTPEALEDLRRLRVYEQRQIFDAAQAHLSHHPDQVSRNRKRLRPNKLAEWALRVGSFRVFYDIDSERQIVIIETIGSKQGNKLFIGGEEYNL